ncbi:MAG: hypothetical protein CVU95_00855 [Firmicutes bacterium HGW-Firmicutes-2]|jgi:hypothetical protein|nr:MAG: hypothetical protein CVU95_00855 [Firmicutes bacterium HGW-Firmicutes-2]
MAEFLRYGHVKKTRKDKRCFACGDMIEKGSEANTWTSVDGGSVFTEYLHTECYNDLGNYCSGCRQCAESGEYWDAFMYESAINDSDCEPAKRLRDKISSD